MELNLLLACEKRLAHGFSENLSLELSEDYFRMLLSLAVF
jgi:hypothetical protein